MKRISIIFAALGLFAVVMPPDSARAQSDNSVHVKAYPGPTVGQMISQAMVNCPSASAGPCLLIIDASLAAYPSGTIPTLCGTCSLIDYRNGNGSASFSQPYADIQSFGVVCGASDLATASNNAAIFNGVIRAVLTGPSPPVLFVPNKTCATTSWNLTDLFDGQVQIIGMPPSFYGPPIIQCVEASQNSGNCIDGEGSNGITIQNVTILGGTSNTNAPQVTVFLGRDTTDQGASGHFNWTNVSIRSYGQFPFYDHGGEIVHCFNCDLANEGTAGQSLATISPFNTAGIQSAFVTTRNDTTVSMGEVHFTQGNYSCVATVACFEFDLGTYSSEDIGISGYSYFTTGVPFVSDDGNAAGTLRNLGLDHLRVEAHSTGASLLSLAATVKALTITTSTFVGSGLTNPEISLTGTVQQGFINYNPGDSPTEFPSTVVSCTGTVNGLLIFDAEATGGGSMVNSCPGDSEVGSHELRLNFSDNGANASMYVGGSSGQWTLNILGGAGKLGYLSPYTYIYAASGKDAEMQSGGGSYIAGIDSNGLFSVGTTKTLGTANPFIVDTAGWLYKQRGSAIASASSITPPLTIFHVTGTTAINTIVVPTTCTIASFTCEITIIPDGLFTTGTTGNIAIASTAVVSKALIMTYDATAAKWYPSY